MQIKAIPPKKKNGIALRRNDVVDDCPNDQSQTCSYREGDGHARHRYSGHEEQISKVKDDAPEEKPRPGCEDLRRTDCEENCRVPRGF